MLVYTKLSFSSQSVLGFVFQFLVSAHIVLFVLAISRTSWVAGSQVTGNPNPGLSSSTPHSIHITRAPSRAESSTSELSYNVFRTRQFSANVSSSKSSPINITFNQSLTREGPSSSRKELSGNRKRSTNQDIVTSSIYDLKSELNHSAEVTLIQNMTTSKLVQHPEVARLQQHIAKQSNISSGFLQKQDSSNFDTFSSDSGKTRPRFENLIKIVNPQNSNHTANASQDQETMTTFRNVSTGWRNVSTGWRNASTGWRNLPDVNISNNAFNGQPFPEKARPEDVRPCDDNCVKNQGNCVMGSDFKPYCDVAVDACQQMPCVTGHCVSKDGRHKCQCDQGWVGTFCATPCKIDCGENGKCDQIDQNGTVGCICNRTYTGNRCQEKEKEPTIINAIADKELKVWEKAIAAVVAVVVLALFCILLPYLLWRRQWMPMRRLVFYFQDFEDDDEKEYDAFISYKSTPSDEGFILRHLYPKLEKELHFRLCLHFRDFPPGEPIANNIIRAIEGSRRTILILSPSFISSEWCRMEYQKAQHEMLRLKHKIIPIIVEDISAVPEIDKNLKTIIDTVTYITWPGDEESSSSSRLDKFWKLLELSMPKRRQDHIRGIISPGSCSSEVPLAAMTFNSSGLSSLSCDDFLGGSNSRCQINFSNSFSSRIYTTKASPSIENHSLSKSIQSQLETVFPIMLPAPPETRQEVKDCRISVRDNEAQLCGETISSSRLVEQVAKSSISFPHERNKSNAATRGNALPTGNPPSIHKTNDPEVLDLFLTSDDNIVEIREAGSGSKRSIIKPRPRQLPQQLFV